MLQWLKIVGNIVFIFAFSVVNDVFEIVLLALKEAFSVIFDCALLLPLLFTWHFFIVTTDH